MSFTEFTIFLGFNDDRWLKDSLQERYMKMKGMLNRIDYCASAGLKEIEENPYDQDGKLLSEKTESY
jgi:CRISPR-associated endonuclease/helicase Cas3